MKTKELIKRLMEADPTGEEEACVDNVDIHYVSTDPAYYDGTQEVLKRDASGHIVGAKYLQSGCKVRIRTLSIEDALADDSDLPIDYSDLHPELQESLQAAHGKLRKELDNEVHDSQFRDFVEHAIERALRGDLNLVDARFNLDGIDQDARSFFDQHLYPGVPFSMGTVSIAEQRKQYWAQHVELSYEEGRWRFQLR